MGGKEASAVALYGYQARQQQNQLTLRSGYLPRTANQIVLDQRAKTDYGYRLGDTYTFAKSAKLGQRSYRIVGFADSPMYIDNESRGSANVGDGTVRYFAYVPAQQLKLKVATLLNVRFKGLQTSNTFTDQYQNRIDQKVTALKRVFKSRAKARTAALQGSTLTQLKRQQRQLTQAKQQLKQAAKQGDSAMLAAQQTTLTTQQAKLTAAKKQLLAATQTTYTWQDRDDLPGFEAYGESSERIAAIANVFPVFFFLIAALITFTTITRMVEEARGQIGTFKALGYGKWLIARNYLGYALLAGVSGTVLGALIGNLTLPRLVLALYQATFR